MIGVVIASHGKLAEELLRTAEAVVGRLDQVRTVNVVATDPEVRHKIAEAIRAVDGGEGVVLLTDLLGGSPTQLCLSFLAERRAPRPPPARGRDPLPAAPEPSAEPPSARFDLAHVALFLRGAVVTLFISFVAMALAIPPKVQFQVMKIAAAAELLKPGGTGVTGVRTLVLVRDVRDAFALHELGVPLPRLNLGNVHFATGRRQVAPSVYLDTGEMEALARLASGGTEVEARAVPSEHATPLSVLQSRFAALPASPR